MMHCDQFEVYEGEVAVGLSPTYNQVTEPAVFCAVCDELIEVEEPDYEDNY